MAPSKSPLMRLGHIRDEIASLLPLQGRTANLSGFRVHFDDRDLLEATAHAADRRLPPAAAIPPC
jgi:hypothetical protein